VPFDCSYQMHWWGRYRNNLVGSFAVERTRIDPLDSEIQRTMAVEN
jgi:hypothetical protein